MNGVHDMGGMHGFGRVTAEVNEPLGHAVWETRVFGIQLDLPELNNIDEFRYGIEQMPPATYLRSSYYERWLATLEYNLALKGVLSRGEIDARVEFLRAHPDAHPTVRPRDKPPREAPIRPDPEPATPPRFLVGDSVRARNVHPAHHTRAPRYVRGKRGVINMVHGPFVFPDTHAHGSRPELQVVYNVRFDARELWGADAEPSQTVSIDLWENYLEPISV